MQNGVRVFAGKVDNHHYVIFDKFYVKYRDQFVSEGWERIEKRVLDVDFVILTSGPHCANDMWEDEIEHQFFTYDE